MASATGIPQEHPDTIQEQEDAPLLHTPGNVPQEKNAAIYQNLFTGELIIPLSEISLYPFPANGRYSIRHSQCSSSWHLDGKKSLVAAGVLVSY